MDIEVKREDLIGKLEGFPIEVVQKMLEHQLEQTGVADVSVFQTEPMAGPEEGGFLWDDADEGWLFWNSVITHHEWDTFFTLYPKMNQNRRKVGKGPNEYASMTKAEEWILSRIKCPQSMDRLRRVQWLIEKLNKEGTSIYNLATIAQSTKYFDFVPFGQDLSSYSETIGSDVDSIYEVNHRIGSVINDMYTMYREIRMTPGSISYETIHFGGKLSDEQVIGWLKRNIHIAKRLRGCSFKGARDRIRVSYIGQNFGGGRPFTDCRWYRKYTDDEYEIDGHMFKIY